MQIKQLKYSIIFSLAIIFATQPVFAVSSKVKSQVEKALKSYSFATTSEQTITKKLWHELAQKGHVILMGKDEELRSKAINMQAIIESAMLKAVHSNDIDKVVMAIHSPLPATPFRITENNILPGIIPTKYEASSGVVRALLFRHSTLVSLLKEKADFFSVYNQTSTTKIIGYSNYQALLDKYKNLQDKSLKEIPNEYLGATYLMQDKIGNITAFSIHSTQLTNAPEGIQKWEIWFGSINNSEVSKRIVQVDSFLKSQGIDLYKTLDKQ